MKPIPKQIVVNTGEEHTIRSTIDSFFVETKEHIEKTYPGNNYFNITHSILYKDRKETDEELELLKWKDRLVAGVLCTRTEFNNVQYTFFRSFDEVERTYRQNT